ncbi:MAG: HAD family phosphatase [Gammaproteobacteria bacterium]|nr:HAD family phosphatase [Gammaproteobacteria bacterium]
MDGVISDTQKLHSKIESELLARYDVHITPENITKKYSGIRTKEFFYELLKNQKLEYNLDTLMNEKWNKMKKSALSSVDAIEGSVDLIKKLFSKNYALAVASASNLNYVQSVLKTLGIIDYFSYIVSGNMVSKGKPNPESFLLAASKIKVTPEKCLVIEDGVSGMEAAKSANMKCIGLVNDKNKSYPTENLVVSLSEITQNYLEQIK